MGALKKGFNTLSSYKLVSNQSDKWYLIYLKKRGTCHLSVIFLTWVWLHALKVAFLAPAAINGVLNRSQKRQDGAALSAIGSNVCCTLSYDYVIEFYWSFELNH